SGKNATLRSYAAGESRILLGLRHTGALNGSLAGEIEEARLYDRALTAEEVAASSRAGAVSVPLEQVVAALTDEQLRQRETLLADLARQRDALKALPPVPLAYAANPKPPAPTHVLLRGDVEKQGEPVSAGGLSAVQSPPADFGLAADAAE